MNFGRYNFAARDPFLRAIFTNIALLGIATSPFMARADEATSSACPSGTYTAAANTIQSNFNGTAIPAGNAIWFNSIIHPQGISPSGTTIQVAPSQITFTPTANGGSGSSTQVVNAPGAVIYFSPTATSASTYFDGATWQTTVPVNYGKNVFLTGAVLPLSSGLPGGINPVSWTATFSSDTPGVTVQWQWAASVYSQLSTDDQNLGVKSVDDNTDSTYPNSDHAGTPEVYKSFVVGGARGGGGSNYTGSYSATNGVGLSCPSVIVLQ